MDTPVSSTIEKAHSHDVQPLTELCMRSKNYWNYGINQIEKWKEELTISAQFIDENQVYKLIVKEELIGFYAFQPLRDKEIKLTHLFIAPAYIGKGYGKLLMSDFMQRIKKSTYEKITLDADPNAKEFYERMGFTVVGKIQSSIKHRFLPIMKKKIDKDYPKSQYH
jgi:ribosomal protein S18 acetylase RimI-like enzyme